MFAHDRHPAYHFRRKFRVPEKTASAGASRYSTSGLIRRPVQDRIKDGRRDAVIDGNLPGHSHFPIDHVRLSIGHVTRPVSKHPDLPVVRANLLENSKVGRDEDDEGDPDPD